MPAKKSKTILLIDDDPKFTDLLKAALQPEQVETVVAPKAGDGTVEISGRSFDLIILDGELPDMNGLQWLEQNKDKVQNTPVMFVSASWRDTESHSKLVNELGVRCVVHKPVSIEVLVDEAMRLVHRDAKPVEGFEAKLNELTVHYAAELTGEFKRIFDIVRYCRHDQIIRYDLDGVINAAHKIHGTAGLYGFAELGRISGMIEAELKEVKKEEVLSDTRRAKLVALLQRASDEAAQIASVSGQKQAEMKSEQQKYERASSASARRVLMVDDDVFFLKRLEFLLAAEGILLNSYSDSKQVLQAIENFNADLLVLDVNMPGTNGYEICSAVRQREKNVPIIIVSADTAEETKQRAIASGATTFVPKPVKNMQFVELIKEMINRPASAPSAPPRT